MSQTTPFTAAELTSIRHFCGFAAYAAFGYTFETEMATLDTQCAAMSDSEQALVRTQYLAVLPGLEQAIYGASGTLNVDVAAAFTRNANEVSDRRDLFNTCRRELCAFVGVLPGPGVTGGNARVVRT